MKNGDQDMQTPPATAKEHMTEYLKKEIHRDF